MAIASRIEQGIRTVNPEGFIDYEFPTNKPKVRDIVIIKQLGNLSLVEEIFEDGSTRVRPKPLYTPGRLGSFVPGS